jgi:hypothetical protein
MDLVYWFNPPTFFFLGVEIEPAPGSKPLLIFLREWLR